ncbi:hypothetical protein K3495_g3370 [Podosphaera aphanis]|nr:hypothetical protein K3495_g3370 [Podosphaera aphanis]
MSGLSQASKHINVLGSPLAAWSSRPMTGFYRNGYCQVGTEDTGNHSVAAILTDRFLDFTASRGNNLRSIGLTGGCKWCLCAARWREALEFAKAQDAVSGVKMTTSDVVPRVDLNATHIKALDVVELDQLKRFAAN